MKIKKIWGTMHPFFEGGPVLGRKVANSNFLTALLEADPYDEYHFFLTESKTTLHLESVLQEKFASLWGQGRLRVSSHAELPNALVNNKYSCFHFSDWVGQFVDISILRNVYSNTIFPVTAPVHTLSYAKYGAAFLRHLWAGVSSRDVIVATSTATEDVIAGYFAQLRDGYGLPHTNFFSPAVKRIPLGVDPALFAPPHEKELLGKDFRERLGVTDEVVFLSFSRVSYLSKMDFLPILDAFKRAEAMGLCAGSYHFVLAGRVDNNDPFIKAIIQLAKNYTIKFSLVQFPNTPNDEERKALFAAADVFLSPVDNIQETFGLTILEAYAASLPVIASAIDGYKDLIINEETGFLIPTVGPSSVESTNALAAVITADVYHLQLAQQCVVEVAPFAKAIALLGGNAALRKQMGQNGYQRMCSTYTWGNVVNQYIDLWNTLESTPLSEKEVARVRAARHPSLPHYVNIFSGYFSAVANDAHTQQRLVQISLQGKLLQQGNVPLVIYALIKERINRDLLNQLLVAAAKPVAFATLAAQFATLGRTDDKDFLLLWALKHDLLEFVTE